MSLKRSLFQDRFFRVTQGLSFIAGFAEQSLGNSIQVNEGRNPVVITSKRGDAVLISQADYDALEETAYLLRVPANAKYLLESLAEAKSGQCDEL